MPASDAPASAETGAAVIGAASAIGATVIGAAVIGTAVAGERLVPEGWYPDPMGFAQLRWWDGRAWTAHLTQPVVAAPTVIPAAVRPAAVRPAAVTPVVPPVTPGQPLPPPAPLRPNIVPLIVAGSQPTTRREQRLQRIRDEQFAYNLMSRTDIGPQAASDPAEASQAEASQAVSSQAVSARNAVSVHPTNQTSEQPASSAPRSLAYSILDTGPILDPDEVALDEQEEALYLPRRATSAVSAPASQPAMSAAFAPSRDAVGPRPTLAVSHADAVAYAAQAYTQAPVLARGSPTAVYTWPAWVIALVPVIQLLASLIVLLQFGATPEGWANSVIMVSVFGLVLLLAITDFIMLKRARIPRPSTWVWALLGAPVYLISRSIALFRHGRAGLAPPLVWAFVALLQIGCFVVAPGILIAALPSTFASQVERSVVNDASNLGLTLRVSCPAVPPTMIGERFVCGSVDGDGVKSDVTVSLQRLNGWIDWHVDDWGVHRITRQ